MNTKQLKDKILAMAMRGELVEQNPSDESAEILLEKIKEEKAKLIADKKIKKEKPLAPIEEDEVPYDLPQGWAWTRLGEIGTIVGGGTPKTNIEEYWENGTISWITPADLSNYTEKYIVKGNRNITELGLEKSSAKLMPKGTVLFSSRAPIGYVVIAEKEVATNQGFKSVVPYDTQFSEYIYYYLKASKDKISNLGSGTTFKEVSGTVLGNFIISLPPLAEQKRIVEKIETLFAEVDKLEESRENLDGLKGKLEKKLLDMAMRGELVEQDPTDESAEILLEKIKEEKAKLIAEKKIKKEKPLAPIEEDEIPYDLPQGWVWTRLGEYMDVRDGTHDTPKYFETGNPLVTSKNLVNDTIDFEDTKKISDEDCEKINQRSLVEEGDILMAMIGTIGRAIVVPKIEFPYAIKNVALFKKINPIQDTKFIKFYLNCIEDSLKNTASGGNQKFLSLSRLRSLPIPLPPLAEQKRIVEKLEEVREIIRATL